MPIEYTVARRIARIVIDRPAALNALDLDHSAALAAAFRRFGADEAAHVAILTGAGERAFCAGADVKSFIPAWTARARAGQPLGEAFGGITGEVVTGKPIIGAINGLAIGGGFELMLCCDLRVAAAHARFGLPETRLGIIPGAGGTQRLPREIPLARAMELILTGDQIDAPEALRWGLVNQVVDGADLSGSAVALAERVLSNGPLAIRAAKRAVLKGLGGSLDEGLQLERQLLIETLGAADAAEGLRAFIEKRSPNFEGM